MTVGSMQYGPALVAIYLTVLAVFVAMTRFPAGISLILVIIGFVSFLLSFLPAGDSDSSADSESSPDTRSRWW